MKKSQISIQFHWIFIVIAGAVILGFFIGIALRQKAVAEKRLALDVREKLNEIFSGAGISEKTAIRVFVPDVEIEFSCIANVSQYSLKGTGVSKDIPYDLIFAPDLVRVKRGYIVTWTLPWKVPFNVQNFLMISSPDVRYVFVYDDGSRGLAMDIINATPDMITKEWYHKNDIESIVDKGDYRVRFVFVQTEPVLPSGFVDLKDEIVSAVKINVNPAFVQFYEKEGDGFSSDYYTDHFDIKLTEDDPMMYAAIFASGIEMYRCNMAKAYSRLVYVAGIYKERVLWLKQDHEAVEPIEYPVCSMHYRIDGFDNLIEGAQKQNIDMITGESAAGKIKSINEGLERVLCPTIY